MTANRASPIKTCLGPGQVILSSKCLYNFYASPLKSLNGGTKVLSARCCSGILICPKFFSYFTILSCSAKSKRLAFSGVITMRDCTQLRLSAQSATGLDCSYFRFPWDYFI